MRDVGEPESHVVMTDLHSCANCHSFSRERQDAGPGHGRAAERQGTVRGGPGVREMTIRTQDMISWSSFRKELGRRNSGSGSCRRSRRTAAMWSRRCGRRHTKNSQFYYVSNFKDYRFLQVFYPTRGILALVRSQTKEAASRCPAPTIPTMCRPAPSGAPTESTSFSSAPKPAIRTAKTARWQRIPTTQRGSDPVRPLPHPVQRRTGRQSGADRRRQPERNEQRFAKVSPDGKWIVFVEARNGLLMRPDSKLYIVPASGGKARR